MDYSDIYSGLAIVLCLVAVWYSGVSLYLTRESRKLLGKQANDRRGFREYRENINHRWDEDGDSFREQMAEDKAMYPRDPNE
jgi:hypothetical protein